MNFSGFESLHVTETDAGRVVRVTLDHGRANEMGREQVAEWERLTRLLADHPARSVITRSTKKSRKGTPIFIAGANVTEREGWTHDQIRTHVRWQRATLAAIRVIPQFHIAVVEGVALGWGTEFLLACDYRIATPTASFALPETGLGILPGAGGTAELSGVVGIAQALRLGMTGERVGAEEALRIGLVQESATDANAALTRADALASLAARRSPTAIAAYKTGALAALGRTATERTDIEARAYEQCIDSGDAAIGRAGFDRIVKGRSVEWGPRIPYKVD